MLAKQSRIFDLIDQAVVNSNRRSGLDIDVQVTDGFVLTQSKNKRFYFPSPTGQAFHADDSFFKVLMGPFGSGKSVICSHEIVFRTITMPKCIDGVRRAKWCVVRNTYRMLEISTVRTWLDWFAQFGQVRITQRPPYYFCEFWDEQGKCELELIFLALDRPGQLESLKSAEFTGAWLNELSGLQEAVFQFMKGRINGRYPSKSICPDRYWTGVIADTNPPTTRSWIYRMFEKEIHPEFKLYKQPPGLVKDDNDAWIDNVNADNKKNLSPDYYQKMTLGANEEFIRVFCLGEYGAVLDGKPVYPEYNDDLHSVVSIKPIDDNLTLILGWDFGLTPACVISQLAVNGRVQVLDEIVSLDMDLEQFITSMVIPFISSRYPHFKVQNSFVDPAGVQRAQTDGNSCYTILDKYGYKPAIAPSQDPLVRQRAVHNYLNKLIDGKPALMLSRTCNILREGFLGGYQYRKLQTGQGEKFADTVEKNEYSHAHDALQYLMLGISDLSGMDVKGEQVIYYPDCKW